MRPLLAPGISWAWRSPDTLQFGLDVPHPLVVGGIPPFGRQLLPLLNGTTERPEIVAALQENRSDRSIEEQVLAVIDRLMDLGVVVDGGSWPGALAISAELRDQLTPDLRCASAMERFRSEPAARWRAFTASEVVIAGASRLGATIGRTLMNAGVGRVVIKDSRDVSSADVSVGGYAPSDVGLRRSEWLSSHPEWSGSARNADVDRQLVVVTDAVNTDSICRTLASTDKPHLVVSCREMMGRVGPFVEPGTSPCHFCASLTRRDHDPQWANIWRQQQFMSTPDADTVLAGVTAYISVAHVLDWLTGGRPPSIGGFVEISAPHGATEARQFSQHPECGCAWPDSSPSQTMAG